MLIIFAILLLFSSELIYQIANDFEQGFNPYPFGTPIFLIINHIVILVACIRYCDWIVGIILFLIHIFGGLHATYAWIFSIPALLYMNPGDKYGFPRRVEKLAYFKLQLLTPILIVNALFSFFSFLFVPSNAFGVFISKSHFAWIVLSVLAFVFSFLRGFLFSILMPKTQITNEPLDSYYTKNNFFK